MDRIRNLIKRMRQNSALKRKAVAKAQAEQSIQLCEYNKRTYICVGGVPVINTAWLSTDLYEVLDGAREVSSDYLSKRR